MQRSYKTGRAAMARATTQVFSVARPAKIRCQIDGAWHRFSRGQMSAWEPDPRGGHSRRVIEAAGWKPIT
jgi:hypothetical protein